MAFVLRDEKGELRKIRKHDKVTMIDGRKVELWIDECAPMAHYGLSFSAVNPEPLHYTRIAIECRKRNSPTTQTPAEFGHNIHIHSGFPAANEYDEPFFAFGQIRYKSSEALAPGEVGDNSRSDLYFIFEECDTNEDAGLGGELSSTLFKVMLKSRRKSPAFE